LCLQNKARELVESTEDIEEREEGEKIDELMDFEPSRVDLFAKCYTREGNTSNSVIADSLVRFF